MVLYKLLMDRIAVNVLKVLYDHEVREKASYSTKLSEIKKRTAMPIALPSLQRLSSMELITMDLVEGEHILSITNKGKEFIEIFDQLIELFQTHEREEQKGVRVKYELTNQEKRILILAYKMSKESGVAFVPLKSLATELYPHSDYRSKMSTVSRYVTKLEEIQLMERKKEDRLTLVKVTDKGFKTIKEQYLKGLML
ncbi:hypothetical protein HY488_00905 [Candidatus Woesearchaeota archaeon]|nr:hypothetical protein [Candidatus Woesearchaeota archaeon]